MNRCGGSDSLKAARLAPVASRSRTQAAVAALRPLGIEHVLETQEINEAAFKANPSEPNRL